MGKLSSLLFGTALGAGLMYFLDPVQGNRRKAMIRDQATQFRHNADDSLDTAVRDLRLRVRGILAEGMAMVSEEGVSDQVLEARIRSRLGFLTRHPGAIEISVRDKVAYLNGDVLANEAEGLAAGIQKTRGLNRVENMLRVHETADNIPQLQGKGWMPGDTPASKMWSPSSRLLAGIGAGYMLIYGMARGGFIGSLAQAVGVVLGARAVTNMNLKRMVGMGEDEGSIRVRKTININAPVEEVYDLWSNFENFPRFMSNIEDIKDMGNGRSHWVVKGPAGSKVEFDAVLTENRPNEVVAWKTIEDSSVKHTGQVRFKEGMHEGTQVNVNMAYTPPAGIVGHTVASVFGKDPKSAMDDDLVRMKSLLEEGKTRAEGHTVTRDEVKGGKNRRENSARNQIPNTGADMDMPTDIVPIDDDETDITTPGI
jgi:uncharacterized membrane protein